MIFDRLNPVVYVVSLSPAKDFLNRKAASG